MMTRRQITADRWAPDSALVGLARACSAGTDTVDRPAGAQAATFSGQGEARHLPVSEWRAVAGGHIRSEADAGQVSRQADALRQSADRAQDRQPC